MTDTRLSIVTTLYNSSDHVDEFCHRALAAADEQHLDVELVLVDDGSFDDTVERVRRYQQRDGRLQIVELSRNHGHHQAIMVGLECCSGDEVFLIDSDLEESPEWLGDFMAAARYHHADVVIGKQRRRRGSMAKRLGGRLFYTTYNAISRVEVPVDATCARLMNRRFVNALLEFKEREPFFAGLCRLAGFVQRFVVVDKPSRGRSSYSTLRRARQAVNAIVSFSSVPLYAVFAAGALIFVSALLTLLLSFNHAAMIASIWGVGGLGMMCTGILGVYLAQVLNEVKRRPTVIKRVSRSKPTRID